MHEVPGVVVWSLLLKWGLGWEMLGDISYRKATLQSEGKHSIHIHIHIHIHMPHVADTSTQQHL